MARRELLSIDQRCELFELPTQMAGYDLSRHYLFTNRERTLIEARHSPHNRLGYAIQLAFLKYPGSALKENEIIPGYLTDYVSEQIGINPSVLTKYKLASTRSEHLNDICVELGYRSFGKVEEQELKQAIHPVALSTGRGIVLMTQLISDFRKRRIILPSPSAVELLCWTARDEAETEIFTKLGSLLSAQQRKQFDDLIISKGGEVTRLSWLRSFPERASATNCLALLERLDMVRSIGVPSELERCIHRNWFQQLAKEGWRYKSRSLARFDTSRRIAILVAFLLDFERRLMDVILDMLDKMVGQVFKRSERKHQETWQQNSSIVNQMLHIYMKIGKAVVEAVIKKEDLQEAIECVISFETLSKSVSDAEVIVKKNTGGFLDYLKRHDVRLRRVLPKLLNSVEFESLSGFEPVLNALKLLKKLYDENLRKIPDDAPKSFIKARWKPFVYRDTGIDRRYYTMCVLSELRNGLRAGDIWITGSQKHRAFDDYLISEPAWQRMKETNSIPLPIEIDCETYITRCDKELREQFTIVEELARTSKLPDARIENGRLTITPLDRAVPDSAEEWSQRVYRLMPRIKLTDLLLEVDGWTGFSTCFTHLNDESLHESPMIIHTAVLADAINMSYRQMADACAGVHPDQLAWAADWYIREENYTRALAQIVNLQHKQPIATQWGDGTTSSSDGQHFKAGSRLAKRGEINARYGNQPSVIAYTHLSNQYAPFHARLISSLIRDSSYVLDGLLYHETDLTIHEHYTDTAGYTDHIFAMCRMLGFRFAPRLRDLADRKLYPIEISNDYPILQLLCSEPINTDRIKQNWNDILRLAASIRTGTVTASLLLKKLAAYSRQNSLAVTLRDIGRIERTLYILEWMRNPELRRKVQVGLNKGESRHALCRAVHFNRLGEFRDRTEAVRQLRAQGLNLVTAAIVLWNTVYLAKAVEKLESLGTPVPPDCLPHVSPLGWEHITLTGEYKWTQSLYHKLEVLRPLQSGN